MKRHITIVTCVAFLAGFGSVSALTTSEAVTEQDPFRYLKLGMPVKAAFFHMQQLDEAAFEGPVCSGADGIAAHVNHLGMTWNLSAHKKDGKIDEFVLERRSRKATATTTSCRGTFEERVVPHYNRMHASPTWTTRDEPHHLHVLHTSPTEQSQSLALFAGRENRADALCTYRIVYR